MTQFSAIVRTLALTRPDVVPHLQGRAYWIARGILAARDIDSVKTYEHYLRQIQQAVRAVYFGNMTEFDFVSFMAEIIPAQLTKAWREGMRDNGLDPDADMLEEWQLALDARILSEFNYVDGFAADIAAAALEQSGLDGLLSRAATWANRYNDVYNESKMATSQGTTKYRWERGNTEEHCWVCTELDGIVAFSREWEQSGFRTQDPPNRLLGMTRGDEKGCGGWHCDCRQVETTQRRTPKALDRLIDIAMSGW